MKMKDEMIDNYFAGLFRLRDCCKVQEITTNYGCQVVKTDQTAEEMDNMVKMMESFGWELTKANAWKFDIEQITRYESGTSK